MGFGPQQMPPQGARALVWGLMRGGKGAPKVVATLDESDHAAPGLEFVNEGGGTANDLRFVVQRADGTLYASALGNLPPGASSRAFLGHAEVPRDFRCAWWYGDARGRTHARSYDGRRKIFRRNPPASPEAIFRAIAE